MHQVGFQPIQRLCYFFSPRFVAMAMVIVLFSSARTVPLRAQNVGVNTATPDATALLDLESTALGFLPPRMTSAQMLGIPSPATGDLVYNITSATYFYYTGSYWTPLVGIGWGLTGNSGTNPSTYFLGTIDSEDLVQRTNSIEHLRVYSSGKVGLTNANNIAEILYFFEASGLGSLYTAFRAGVQKADTLGVIIPHYIWPLGGDGLPDQCLVTDGSGNLSWHTFATFSGSGNELLWSRGSGPYGEYSDSADNSTSAAYTLVAGFDNNNVSANYDIIFGDSGQTTAQGAVTSGGSGNTSSAYAIVRGGQDNSSSANYSTTYGGASNSTSAQDAATLGGFKNKISATGTTIINGTGNSSNANYQLIMGTNISISNTYEESFRPGTGVGTRLGVNTCTPAQAADIVGPVKFSGALKPNNTAGSSGQYLLSAGAASPPTWGGATFSSTNWKLAGTSGTAPATNYIGTTDAQDLAIRTNNTPAMRITAAGLVGVGTATPAHQLASILSGTTDETAAIYGEANAVATTEEVGVWGIANTGSSNTGTIGTIGTGNGSLTAGTTNAAVQISQGEWTMGRTTESSSAGSDVEPAASGTLYSQQGPSGVIQFSLLTDLNATHPVAGVFEDLGTVTIDNQYIDSSSIVLACVVQKINGGADPDPKNSIYKVDVQSASTGSCIIHVGMIPTVSDLNNYQGSDYIKVAYVVINPGR